MNKALLLLLLVDEARRQASRYEGYRREVKLEECLVELNNRRPIELPSHLPQEPESMLAVLQQLGPRIGLLSLVLSQEFPDKFLLYRAPLLDREIFDGLAFFADLEPSFRFPFASVGNDLDRYVQLNKSLHEFGHAAWPELRHPQAAILAFLYEGLGMLFLEKSSYNRYWIMVTKPEYWGSLDREGEGARISPLRK